MNLWPNPDPFGFGELWPEDASFYEDAAATTQIQAKYPLDTILLVKISEDSPCAPGSMWFTERAVDMGSHGFNFVLQECVYYSPPPVLHAEFHALACSGWRPFEAQFVDDSTGSPDKWYWRFGDGEHSSAQHPTHTYAGYGSYDVQLEAGLGVDWSFCTKINYIVVLLPPLPISLFIPVWTIHICPDE